MTIPLIFLAMALGAIISIYLPMIAQTARLLGSAPMANVPFFGIAFAASIVIALATGGRGADFAKIGNLPVWLLTAGVMSAGMIIGSSYLVPRIGIGAFFVLLVSGQVLAGLVFGQLGLFGAPSTALTVGKVAGAFMVIAGVYLVTFK
ncbi:DMT family transporter [Ostreiculturibacter nitratireducens]|uniref:DMT family transporter n=1 Tax=Ostreiculturibacter nitratireducens TaxID=3075226 RepID=UPI0031B61375